MNKIVVWIIVIGTLYYIANLGLIAGLLLMAKETILGLAILFVAKWFISNELDKRESETTSASRQ